MPVGLAISILVHTAVLLWAIVSFKSVAELPAPETPAINVELITPSELLRLKQGSETAKELEAQAKENPEPPVSKTEAEKPKPVAAPPPAAEPPPPEPEPEKPAEPEKVAKLEPPPVEPPKPLPSPVPEVAPGPTPAEKKALEEKLEQDRKADEQRQEDERKKAEDKKKADEKKKADDKKKKDQEKKKLADAKKAAEKKKFDVDRIAALLDKTPDKKGAPLSATQPSKPTDYKGPTAGTRDGRDTVLSLREQDMLKGQISGALRGCWRLPGGGGGIETTVVTLRWRLRQDGTLDGEPSIVDPQGGPVFGIAAEAAIRAVKQCTPFTLPPDKYSAWKTIIWDFDPREMI